MSNEQLESIVGRPKQTSAKEAGASRPNPMRLLALLLPAGLVVGFLLVAALLFGDRLLPVRTLELVNVVTIRRNGDGLATGKPELADPFEAAMLFQASGWIEPDPLPIKATALYSGVVRTVGVLEGQKVDEGQLLATLVDDDAKIALRSAEARLAALEAQSKAHESQIVVSRARVGTLAKQLAAAEAKRRELANVVERYADVVAGGISKLEVAQAQLEMETQEAEIAALAATRLELEGDTARHVAIKAEFKANIADAEATVAQRKLDLQRTRIVSPVNGIVLRLLAVPGQKRMLEMDDSDSATVAILYEPGKLQARIDVPLEEAAKLAVGQAVRLRSSLLPDRVFHGTVTRIVGEADLQRNTLQAKVRVTDPDPRLRPEMLCRAEFLAASTLPSEGETAPSTDTTAPSARVAVFVPERAFVESPGGTVAVWALDESGKRIERKSVTLGQSRREDHREIRIGLNPGDRVVLDPPADLEPGERVRARR
jgi:HlyD family secretion protein